MRLAVLLGAALAAALLAACSQNAPASRGLRLAHVETAPDGVRYYSDGRTPLPPATRAAPPRASLPDWSTRMSPGRLPRPETSAPRLRRFAAMPRHKPPAPHVMGNERACLAAGYVRPTRYVRPIDPVGHGACGVANPFLVSAAAGRVRLTPAATLRCQMIPSLDRWVVEVLQPAARAHFASPVVGLKIAASYACRTRNSQPGARLSEHGRGNAIDISEFHLADGRKVSVKDGWRGPHAEARFLRYVHRGGCEHFSTVLGPNADRYHHDHFHFDLASHGRFGTYRVCK